MNTSISIFFNTALFIAILAFVSCGCPEPENTGKQIEIADDFDIVGTWFFQQVSGEGNIFGIDREDIDNEPEGFIRFDADMTGASSFSINLLDLPYEQMDTFRWSRPNDTTFVLDRFVFQRQDTWTICRANNNLIEATWAIEIAGNTANITSILTPEP